ncbi:MAG: ERF family protein [Actinomycetota bacterium]|nr:ERF family protein [Actinomycetota bacterium]
MDTAKLAAALAAFQAEAPTVKKSQKAEVPTKAGGKYTYTFANLANVTEAAYPLLAKHGLAFSACPERTERGYELVGWLLHSSGESLRGALPIQGTTAQEIGSSITYGRRYLIGSMTGVVTDDDDDGVLASRAKKPAAKLEPAETTAPRPPAMWRSTTTEPQPVSKPQLAKIHAGMGDLGITDRDQGLAYISVAVRRQVASSKELSMSEAHTLIDAIDSDLAAFKANPDGPS